LFRLQYPLWFPLSPKSISPSLLPVSLSRKECISLLLPSKAKHHSDKQRR
jgi:hypothetical protein